MTGSAEEVSDRPTGMTDQQEKYKKEGQKKHKNDWMDRRSIIPGRWADAEPARSWE
jgi:hypothetical protein